MQLRLASAALNQTPLDWNGNSQRIIEVIQLAKSQKVDILCLPELCIPGYDCMDHFFSGEVIQKSWDQLMWILPYTQNIGVCLGLPLYWEGQRYNAVAWVVDGQIQGFAVKETLANQGVHYESRWFSPWQSSEELSFFKDGQTYPLGKRLFEYKKVGITFEICEEAWLKKRAVLSQIEQGAQIVLNPSASHFSFDKYLKRRELVQSLCQQKKIAYLYSNQLGSAAGRLLYDGHIMIGAANGLHEGCLGSFKPYELLSANYDVNACQLTSQNDIELREWSRFEQFTQMMTLGLWDILRKTGMSGFVVSLSGGIDSSVCAVLVYLMAKQVEKFGVGHFDCAKNLHLLYQRTAQNSEQTEKAARQLGEALNASYHCIDIEPWFQSFQAVANKTLLEEPLNWQMHDIPLQNLQARLRAPMPWLLANMKGALLLATSNRSECAVGYATMDGDTAGSYSPLAGIDKPFLQAWLMHVYEQGVPLLTGPLKVLEAVFSMPPSAELRPSGCEQTDESDLMPYAILNHIEHLFCVDFLRSPQTLLSALKEQQFPYSDEQLLQWVERFLSLWRRSQWKRERFAPGFYVDDHSVDPKTDARYPILSFV